MDIMFYEVFKEEKAALEKYLPKNITVYFTGKTIQETKDSLPPAKVISVRTQSIIPLHWAEGLKGILTRSQGFDHITDYLKRTNKNIPCGYLGAYSSTAVAEHAVMAMMVLLKRLKKQIRNFDTFNRDSLTGQELKGRNVLVIGVGAIGSEIASLAQGLRMFVKGVDIDPKSDDLEYFPLKEGIGWADVIFCALPLTESTRGLLNYDLLKNARKGTVFINISRGEISPLEDLKKLLSQKYLDGISLDVYEHESLLAVSLRTGKDLNDKVIETAKGLKDNENVLFTPHNAFNTAEALDRKAAVSAHSLTEFLKNGIFPSPVPFL